jgi:hypothetical protein
VQGSRRIQLRRIKLNCAIPLDYRVQAVATKILTDISNDYSAAINNYTSGLKYIDTPNSFRHHIQVNSSPAENLTYFGGPDGTDLISLPLDRSVPPGNEYENALYTCQRALAMSALIRRNSSWMQAGIQRNLEVGDWLNNIYLWQNGVVYKEYAIEGAVNTVIYDFLKQRTTIGDVYEGF